VDLSLPILPLDVLLKGSKLDVPVRLKLVEPGLDRGHGLGAQPENTRPGVGRVTLVADKAGSEQVPEVLAHRRSRRAQGRGQLSCPGRLAAEEFNDPPPGRVGQGVEEVSHLDGRVAIHTAAVHTTAVHTGNN
jgi:hypothetical protein